MSRRLIHLEQLLGRKVIDSNGKSAGRIQEFVARRRDRHYVIEEVLLGRQGLLERLSVPAFSLALLSFAGAGNHPASHRAEWEQLDVSDPSHPRLRCPASDLAEIDGGSK